MKVLSQKDAVAFSWKPHHHARRHGWVTFVIALLWKPCRLLWLCFNIVIASIGLAQKCSLVPTWGGYAQLYFNNSSASESVHLINTYIRWCMYDYSCTIYYSEDTQICQLCYNHIIYFVLVAHLWMRDSLVSPSVCSYVYVCYRVCVCMCESCVCVLQVVRCMMPWRLEDIVTVMYPLHATHACVTCTPLLFTKLYNIVIS